MKTTCKKSWPVNLLYNILWVLYTSYTEVVPISTIFPNLNVVGHLAVPVGWGSCLLRLAIIYILVLSKCILSLINLLLLRFPARSLGDNFGTSNMT